MCAWNLAHELMFLTKIGGIHFEFSSHQRSHKVHLNSTLYLSFPFSDLFIRPTIAPKVVESQRRLAPASPSPRATRAVPLAAVRPPPAPLVPTSLPPEGVVASPTGSRRWRRRGRPAAPRTMLGRDGARCRVVRQNGGDPDPTLAWADPASPPPDPPPPAHPGIA